MTAIPPIPTDASEAAAEIGRLASRIVELCPLAGLRAEIKISPARSKEKQRG